MFDDSLGTTPLRRCGRCGEVRPLDDFAWRRISKGQRDNYCRTCRAAYKQEHYAKNRKRYIQNAAARRARMLNFRVAFLLTYLHEHPCADCGEADVLVLEFDHLRDKSFDIASGIRDRNWDDVMAELAKCEVVCANCHRRRTSTKNGFLRAVMFEQTNWEGDSQQAAIPPGELD